MVNNNNNGSEILIKNYPLNFIRIHVVAVAVVVEEDALLTVTHARSTVTTIVLVMEINWKGTEILKIYIVR